MIPSEQERSAHGALVAFGDLDERIAAALPPTQQQAWRAYRADWKRGAVERPFPLQLDLTLNTTCNMRCPMCTWSDPDMKQGNRAEWMTLEFFRHLVEEAVPQGLKAVGMNGLNEPLMRSDLPDFVRTARDAGVLDIMFHTNGMLLTRSMSRRLIDAGLTRVLISVDAATSETYDKIRVGGNLDTVFKNARMFLEERGQDTLPVLGVCFVKMAINHHELDAFIAAWQYLVDFFAIQSYLNPWSGRADKNALAAPGWRPAQTFVCAQPFQRLKIMNDGSARPCCSMPGERMAIGDTHQESIEALWTGGMMRMLRRLHGEGRGHENPVCRDCIQHSFTEEVPR